MKKAYDLTALAATIEKKSKYGPFAGAVDRMRAAQWVLSHLNQAYAAVMAHPSFNPHLKPPIDKRSAGLLGRAMLTEALITYVRETHGDTRHRTKLDLIKDYAPEQKAKHRRLVDLRNHAIGHSGPGGEGLRKEWNTYKVVKTVVENKETVFSFFGSSNWQGDIMFDLFECIQLASNAAVLIHERYQSIIEAEFERLSSDGTFQEMLELHPFVPEKEFADDPSRVDWFWDDSNMGVRETTVTQPPFASPV